MSEVPLYCHRSILMQRGTEYRSVNWTHKANQINLSGRCLEASGLAGLLTQTASVMGR